MNTYRVAEILADETFQGELLLDPLFLIEPADVPVARSIISALGEWEFTEVHSEAERSQLAKLATQSEEQKAADDARKKEAAKETLATGMQEVSLDDFMSDAPMAKNKSVSPTPAPAVAAKLVHNGDVATARKSANNVPVRTAASQVAMRRSLGEIPSNRPAIIGRGNIGTRVNITPKTTPAATKVAPAAAPKVYASEEARMEVVRSTYADYERYIDEIYTRYATHGDMNKEELMEKVQELCIFIKENQRYMLRLVPSDNPHSKNIFVSHTMRSTVLAIAIGLQMRMSLAQSVELGTACMLHEIGMLRLPPQIYAAKKTLTTSERALMETHCVKGAALAGLLGFEDAIKNGIADHHECKNGSGYPERKIGDRISLYGKVIAVACSFEAITGPRAYKQERSGFEAMVEMLKNKEQRYDDTVIKALLYSLSLFPIGAFVFLVGGRVGQVTDVNPTDPKNPIVQLLNQKDATGQPLAVQTNATDNKIVRVLSRQEIYEAIKNMKRY